MALSPEARARGFVDHLNYVLNRTVTQGRLTLIEHATGGTRFLIVSRQGGDDVAMSLHGSNNFLFFRQLVDVGERVSTQTYSYRLQTDPTDRQSYLLRWENARERAAGFDYALSHLHVNAELDPRPPDKATAQLHLPTARLPLEEVLRHLITEWGVKPLADDWETVLEDSLQGYYQRVSHHV